MLPLARLAALALALALLFSADVARACVNATMREDVAIAKLRRAEEALEAGDVWTARELSAEVEDAELEASRPDLAGLSRRAERVHALSFVRDPRATNEELARAATQLEARRGADDDPARSADYGEALERAGRSDEAYAVLAPLADADLIGSAYAYAALARAANKRDDGARAATASSRCETMAVRPGVCRGEFARPPLARRSLLWYATPGALFALALGLYLLQRRLK